MRASHVFTMAVLLLALGIIAARNVGWHMAEARIVQDPQDTIYSMFDASRAGDVKAYVGNFTGEMEASLRQSINETTEPGFGKYLRDSHASVTGVVVSGAQAIADSKTKLRVEYVFQDRNEAQVMYLEKRANGWKISRMESQEPANTLIPYGTQVR